MKKLVNIMMLVLVLTVLSTIILNASATGRLANDQANYLDDDPNEPEMQGAVVWAGSTCLSDDPNEPEFAGALARAFFSSLSDDPNEPEFAGALARPFFGGLSDDPNEPGPEVARAN